MRAGHGGTMTQVQRMEVEVLVRQVRAGDGGNASVTHAHVPSIAETGGSEGDEMIIETELTFDNSTAVVVSANTEFVRVGAFPPITTRVVVRGLQPGVLYGWKVRAVHLSCGSDNASSNNGDGGVEGADLSDAQVAAPFSKVTEAYAETGTK
jgi:hypothetical protein